MAGRPTLYSDELAETICDRMAEGRSLRSICGDDDMPSRVTVMRWMDDNADFEARCARARVMQADLMDDKVLETAEACTPESAAADRVKISAYQWRAAKLSPKKYGDRVGVDHNVTGDLHAWLIAAQAKGESEK